MSMSQKNSAHTIEGYKYKLYNAYSNLKNNDFIQIARYDKSNIDENEEDISIGDSTILLAGISNMNKEYSKLNYIRGKIIEVQEIEQELSGMSSKYIMIIVKTEFGKTPILFIKNNISYSTKENIEVGDTIEALISITGDLMLNPKATKIYYDKVSAYESFRRALETGDYEIFKNF